MSDHPLDDPETRRLIAEIKLDLLRLRYWRKANFNPNQPRVPRGNPDGGRWTSDGSGSGLNDRRVISDATPDNEWRPGAQYAAARERQPAPPGMRHVRIGNRDFLVDRFQKERFDSATSQADAALSRVRELEPNWRPRPSLYEQTVEGEIRRSLDIVLEAEARLVELGHQSPARVIEIYRGQNSGVDLFGRETWPDDEDVVAYTVLDGIPVFGTNSTAPPYTTVQHEIATRWRDALIDIYPEKLQSDNYGWKPNDAFYHAEASVLLRAAERSGGNLAGRTLDVYVDNTMCNRCDIVLPLLARELGNPTLTFVNVRTGQRTVIRDDEIR